MALHAKQVRVFAFHQQSAGVVVKVLFPSFQLPFLRQQSVVVPSLEHKPRSSVLTPSVALNSGGATVYQTL